jgi:hypothetical protein
MKRPLIATALLAALFTAAPAQAHDVHHGYANQHVHSQQRSYGHAQAYARPTAEVIVATVTVSCFRGPWEEVIWDRPEPVFVDSLVNAGYTYPEAHSMAERVCRDSSGVGNSDNIRATMLRIIESQPPG